MSKPAQIWTFKNSRGRIITTHNAVDAEKYRTWPGFVEVADTTADQTDDTGHVKAYADQSWTKKKLQDEIDGRNDAAGDDEHQIVVDEPGNRAELIAALEADDARRADAANA